MSNLVNLSKKSNIRVRSAGQFLTVTTYQNPVRFDKRSVDVLTGEVFPCNKISSESINFFSAEKDLIRQQNYNDDLSRVSSNFNARRDAFIDLVSANLVPNQTFFWTLTYDSKNVRFVPDWSGLCNDWKLFLRRFKRFYNFELSYVAVPEIQVVRGAWHLHVIVFGCPRLKVIDLRSLWGLGAFNIKRVNTLTTGVAKYLALYLGTGDVSAFCSGKKSYFSSHNLKRPSVSYDLPDTSDYILERTEEYHSSIFGDCKKNIFVKKC